MKHIKEIILCLAFFWGLIYDNFHFLPLGRTSLVLILIAAVFFLYEKKFRSNNLIFLLAYFCLAFFAWSFHAKRFDFLNFSWSLLSFILIAKLFL